MNPLPAPLYSEEEIVARLSNDGRRPLELTFLLGGTITTWDPSPRLPGFYAALIDNRSFGAACDAYLRSKGQAFRDLDELEAHARKNNWPGLDLLLVGIDHWRRQKQQRQRQREQQPGEPPPPKRGT